MPASAALNWNPAPPGPRAPSTGRPSRAPAAARVCGDFEITEARPGAEIQYRALAGPERTHGGYYLSTEGGSTRVRFALEREPRGILARLKSPFRRRMKAEVCQLEQLKSVLEEQAGP